MLIIDSVFYLICTLIILTLGVFMYISCFDRPEMYDLDKPSFLPPGVSSSHFHALPLIPFHHVRFSKEELLQVMNNPEGICMFDIDGTLSLKPSFERDATVSKCIENNYAVGIITAGGYRNAHYFCEELGIRSELPILCDFFSVNKGVTFFQTKPLSNDVYSYAPCHGECSQECNNLKYDMMRSTPEVKISKHAVLKTCALQQISKMYPKLDKKCISLIDNVHSWTCYSDSGEGCYGFGGQYSPNGVTDVDISNLIAHCRE